MKFIIDYVSAIVTLFGLMLGFGLLNSFIEIQATKYTFWNFGKLGLFISSFIGTTIHELSHTFFIVLFGNDIKNFRLFPRLNDIGSGKPLGYVQYSYKKTFLGMISLFFIGIGPILGGPLIILVFLKLLLPTVYDNIYNSIIVNLNESKNILILLKDTIVSFLKGITSIEILSDWKFYLFILIASSIACHVTLSFADIKGATKGLGFVLIGIFIVGLICAILPFKEKVLEFIFLITSFLSLLWIISFIFSILTFLIQYFLHYLIRRN